MKYRFVETCYSTHHPQFGYDANDTLWTSGGGPVVGGGPVALGHGNPLHGRRVDRDGPAAGAAASGGAAGPFPPAPSVRPVGRCGVTR